MRAELELPLALVARLDEPLDAVTGAEPEHAPSRTGQHVGAPMVHAGPVGGLRRRRLLPAGHELASPTGERCFLWPQRPAARFPGFTGEPHAGASVPLAASSACGRPPALGAEGSDGQPHGARTAASVSAGRRSKQSARLFAGPVPLLPPDVRRGGHHCPVPGSTRSWSRPSSTTTWAARRHARWHLRSDAGEPARDACRVVGPRSIRAGCRCEETPRRVSDGGHRSTARRRSGDPHWSEKVHSGPMCRHPGGWSSGQEPGGVR